MKPEPVPSTFAFSSSLSVASLEELFGILANSRSLMKTTDGEVICNHFVGKVVKLEVVACI